MAWMDIVSDICMQLRAGGTASAPRRAHRDYGNIAEAAPPAEGEYEYRD